MVRTKQTKSAQPTHETSSVTIAGNRFNVPKPYRAGHVCTDGEAHALNQVMAENIRNNLSKKSKDGTLTQADVDAYAAQYTFGHANGGFTSRDPVEAEAMNIARAKVKAKGMSASDITKAAQALLAERGDSIRAIAKRRVDELAAV